MLLPWEGTFPLLVQRCAAPQFLVPVQNASSSHPPPVAMVIAVEPGLHLASPAGAERPLTCPRGLLGSEAGLPGAVTQRADGREEGRALDSRKCPGCQQERQEG